MSFRRLPQRPRARSKNRDCTEPRYRASVVLIQEEVVPKAQSPVVRRISEMLHDQFHEVACEPLPKRWIDLIKLLNEKERQQSSPEVSKR